jgi:hypothetical protein
MKISLEEMVRQTLKEWMGARQAGYGAVGRNMSAAALRGRRSKDEPVEVSVAPEPRARVTSDEDYTKTYAFLMGRQNKVLELSLKEIMEEVDAQEAQSCAQALADYLNDNQSVGNVPPAMVNIS